MFDACEDVEVCSGVMRQMCVKVGIEWVVVACMCVLTTNRNCELKNEVKCQSSRD